MKQSRDKLLNQHDTNQILIRRVLSPNAPRTIGNSLKQFLSFESLNRAEWADRVHCSSTKGFPPALWDDDRRGFHLAGCMEFIAIMIIELKSANPPLVGGLQEVCSYSKEVEGCWVCVVPKTRFEKQTLVERMCVELLSSLRESNDYARANVSHGYESLRYLISRNSKDKLTTLNMQVEGSIAWTRTESAMEKACGKIPRRAFLKFTNNPQVQGPNGAISMLLSDSFGRSL